VPAARISIVRCIAGCRLHAVATGSGGVAVPEGGYVVGVTSTFLIELPADDPDRARRFWEGLLEISLSSRRPEQGEGWQGDNQGIQLGLHKRGRGPGDRFSLPYFPVDDLEAALERVRVLGGEIVHPGDSWVICRDSEGTPFGLAGPPAS
jgi:uncharacterized protein